MTVEGASLAIAGLALVVSVVGTALSDRRARASERLAMEAKGEALAMRTDALWAAYIESIHGVLSLDPLAEPVRDAWQRMRVTATALADGLQDWNGLDAWLAAEHALGVTLGRELLENAQVGDSADERLAKMRSSIDWAMALLNNARLFRGRGQDSATIQDLTRHAETVARQVHERNGWEMPEPPAWRTLD